jgi:hypothetical protein
MDRESLLTWWNEAWDKGLWAASWKRSLEGLTGKQAAWKPSPDRHSIWQIAEHMIFWREGQLRVARGGAKASEEEVQRLNFPEPAETSDAAWNATVRRFEETQRALAAAIADPAVDVSRLANFLPHDAYHFGQINYLRALMWLPPLE